MSGIDFGTHTHDRIGGAEASSRAFIRSDGFGFIVRAPGIEPRHDRQLKALWTVCQARGRVPSDAEVHAFLPGATIIARSPLATEFVPALEPGSDVFDVQRATVPEGKIGLYVLKYEGRLTMAQCERLRESWQRSWIAAGAAAAPICLVLDEGIDLKAYGDAELVSLGLMRIPE